MIRRHARAGLTLTEVLVAMFIMALGLIALLTLFPLGAMQIGDALRMGRCTETAISADAVLRNHWRHNVIAAAGNNNGRPFDPFLWDPMDDPNLIQQQYDSTSGLWVYQYPLPAWRLSGGITPAFWGNNDPLVISSTSLMLDTGNPPTQSNPGPAISPYQTLVTAYGRPGSLAPNPNRLPSFPVMVDPFGAIARKNTAGEFWVSGSTVTMPTPLQNYQRFLVPRRVPNFCFAGTSISSAVTANFFSMTDDLAFEKNGAPDPAGTLNRQGRYSFAYMLQRPQYDTRLVTDLKVMVFDGRAPGVSGPEDEMVVSLSWVNTPALAIADPNQPMTATPLYLNVGDKSIRIVLPPRGPNSPALVRRGGWIMDGTTHVDQVSGLNGPRSVRNANFYRIVAIQRGEEGMGPQITLPNGNTVNGTAYVLDLETPIKGPVTSPTAPGGAYTNPELPAQMYLFANLSEVFERPALRLDTGN